MTISLIPNSAPFTEEQRAWLNGFFAGLMGLEKNPSTETPSTIQEQQASGEAEEDFPWHDPALELKDRMELAQDRPYSRQLMAAMAQLDCGTCGYDCQRYAEAIAEGSEKNLTLCAPGGKETAKQLKQLVKLQPPAPATNGQAVESTAASNGKPVDTGYSRSNPYPAKLVEVRNLNKPGSSKHTSHVVLDLSGGNLTYQVGDSLGVYPTNCPELCRKILAACDTSAYNGHAPTADWMRWLGTKYDLRQVSEELIEAMLPLAPDFQTTSLLQELLDDDDQLTELDVLDLLSSCDSVKLPPEGLLAHLYPLAPRLYSIASSPRMYPDQVHLTVGRVSTQKGGRVRNGVASCMFADRLRPGDSIPVFVQPAHGFSLPEDHSTPIIMVGPGTGIAPFRAFLQERAMVQASGTNWLFFGDQHQATDFLYQEEMVAYHQSGLLTRLETAFSRDQAEKIYVQTRMEEHGDELFRWLEEGAHFYVCGDASRMAADVDKALHRIIAKHRNFSSEGAAEYVQSLRETHRYQRDVY